MIGFNGGLIGRVRTTSSANSVPGVWTLREHVAAMQAFAWPGIEYDPYFASVSLLLKGEGANGSTTITDSSANAFTVTASGDAQISTAQSKFGGASLAFGGSGDYLSVSDSSAFNMGTDNFTVEAWFYPRSPTGVDIILSTADPTDYEGFNLGRVGSAFYFSADAAGTGQPWSFEFVAGSFSVNTWNHIAGVRSGDVFTLYGNGVSLASGNYPITLRNNNNILRVGGRTVLSQYFDGYVDEVRITKGIARYTANFTPPTQPFPIS